MSRLPSIAKRGGDPGFLPYVVSWNVTARCNLRCAHCYIDASRPMPGELATDEALRVIDEIAQVNSECILILTGGEPLMRPDLDALVARAAASGMLVVLGTNGTGLTPARAEALASAGLSGVGVSVDSLVDERHDAFRGVAGALEATQRGIRAAKGAGLDVQVQVTLTPTNVEEFEAIARFAREVSATALAVFFLVCTGRGQGLVDLTPHQYERMLERVADASQPGVMIRPRCAPTYRRIIAQRDRGSVLLGSDVGRCMAAKNYCRITPDGRVTPCPYMPTVVGSLRSQSFGEIWETAPLFRDLRAPELGGACGACEYRELCGGCRARALALTGDPLGEDPWCTYEPGSDPPLEGPPVGDIPWTPEAEERLARAPVFVRGMIRRAIEAMARKQGVGVVTPELMAAARKRVGRPGDG